MQSLKSDELLKSDEERRGALRRHLYHIAKVQTGPGNEPRACRVLDISDTGVRLDIILGVRSAERVRLGSFRQHRREMQGDFGGATMSLAPNSLVEIIASYGGDGHGVPGTPAVRREPFVLISSKVHLGAAQTPPEGMPCNLSVCCGPCRLARKTSNGRSSIAYEDALRALQLSSRTDPITTIIAQRIIEAAKTGVRDLAELCALAIKDLRVP